MLASPIGHYVSGKSLVHKLDARIKTLCFIVLIFATALITKPEQLALYAVYVLALAGLAQLSARTLWESVRPIIPFVVIVALFNLFAIQGGVVLFSLGPLAITQTGILTAFLYALRLLLAVALGALLLLTTTPTALTDAFDKLLSPLAKLGMPVHEIAMVMSLALRFVPILADETQSVIDAQTARGGALEDGALRERIYALGAILSAVFAGAIRHAQNLSRALDARCYEGGEGRTHYRELTITKHDLAFAAVSIICLICLIVLCA